VNSKKKNSNKVSLYHLYTKTNEPCPNFNYYVAEWLDDTLRLKEHKPAKAFAPLRSAYNALFETTRQVPENQSLSEWQIHRKLLSTLTNIMLKTDIRSVLTHLSAENINIGGFRSALSQGMAKNTGENLANIIVYVLAKMLAHQDEVLVDKGSALPLRPHLTLYRTFQGAKTGEEELDLPIEGDYNAPRKLSQWHKWSKLE